MRMHAMTQNGNPADEAKMRASKAEIVEFLQEAVVRTEGPDAAALSPDEASLLDGAKAGVNNAVRCIDLLLEQIPHPALRNDLLMAFNEALVYAYILGNYSTPTKSIWQLYRSQHHHQHTKPAIDSRKKAGGVQELIERLANDLWSRKPSYKGNPRGTAKEIQPSFNREIAQLEKIPKAWQPADSEKPDSVKKEIDRIRKRIAKMEVQDNRRSSSNLSRHLFSPMELSTIISVFAGLPAHNGDSNGTKAS